jgi:hypothetical protein
MENKDATKNNRSLMLFLGITLLVQAVTALIGGTIFLGSFDSSEITSETIRNISDSAVTGYVSILLQMITAVVIIMLGVAMYQAAGHSNKTIAIVALCLYIFEATLLAMGQVFVFGLIEVSNLYSSSVDANLIPLGDILFTCREFAGQIAMIPFGIGAILFYYLLLKAKIVPSWLALWGIFTVPLILIGVTLMAFGVNVPFIVFIPYVPFEFFTGIFIIIRYWQKQD